MSQVPEIFQVGERVTLKTLIPGTGWPDNGEVGTVIGVWGPDAERNDRFTVEVEFDDPSVKNVILPMYMFARADA